MLDGSPCIGYTEQKVRDISLSIAYPMGRSQAVRHQVLVLTCGGSNPSAPAI